jgi:hypothetical protein
MTFTITIPQADCIQTPDASGKFEVAYSVANSKKVPSRAQFQIAEMDGMQRAWLSPADGVESDFTAEGTQSFKVTGTIPLSTPERVFSFRLDVANAADPTRDSTRGNPVQVRWVPPPVRHDDGIWKKWGRLIVVTASVVLVLAVGTIVAVKKFSTTQATTEPTPPGPAPVASIPMPNYKLNHTQYAYAVQTLKASGVECDIALTIASDKTVAIGDVTDTTPEPGDPIPANKHVTLTVNGSQVPDALNSGTLKFNDVTGILQSADLYIGKVTGNDINKVIGSNPAPGTILEPGKTVDIRLANVAVPSPPEKTAAALAQINDEVNKVNGAVTASLKAKQKIR